VRRAFFVRREPSVDAAQASLERGRSVRSWSAYGMCAHVLQDWAEDGLVPPLCEAEEVPPLSGDNDRRCARCRLEDAPAYAHFLPGLCAIAEGDDADEALEMGIRGSTYDWLPVLALFEGEEVGTDPDEGWTLFRPTRLLWAREYE